MAAERAATQAAFPLLLQWRPKYHTHKKKLVLEAKASQTRLQRFDTLKRWLFRLHRTDVSWSRDLFPSSERALNADAKAHLFNPEKRSSPVQSRRHGLLFDVEKNTELWKRVAFTSNVSR